MNQVSERNNILTDIREFFGTMFGAETNVAEEELDRKIAEIKAQEDKANIESLENYIIKQATTQKEQKVKSAKVKANVEPVVKEENSQLIENENIVLEEAEERE